MGQDLRELDDWVSRARECKPLPPLYRPYEPHSQREDPSAFMRGFLWAIGIEAAAALVLWLGYVATWGGR